MTNKYLKEIKKEEKETTPLGYAVSGAVPGVLLEPSLRNLAAHLSSGGISRRIYAPHMPHEADLHTAKKMLRKNDLYKTTIFDPHRKQNFKFFGPHYRHESIRKNSTGKILNTVGGVNKIHPDILLHELGHATDYSKHTKLKKALQNTYHGHGRGIAAIAAAASLSSDKTDKYAPLVAAVPGIAQLRSESMANYHAAKAVFNHKGAKAAGKFLTRSALPNMFHYGALNAVAPALFGALTLGKHLQKNHHEKKSSVNKYLEKIAEMSDQQMANQFEKDEKGDVKKYTSALKHASNPKLREAIEYALPEEKIHAQKFEEAVKAENE